MVKISLRKLKKSDKRYFLKWWRDKELIKLTSGILKPISDQEVNEYFQNILKTKNDHHFMIVFNKKIIGHISLAKRKNNWHETQIVIGERKYWGKGYGTKAIQIILKKVKKISIKKIFLEVRPNNIRAIKAYEKCGFKKTRIKRYPNNKYLPITLKMELKVK